MYRLKRGGNGMLGPRRVGRYFNRLSLSGSRLVGVLRCLGLGNVSVRNTRRVSTASRTKPRRMSRRGRRGIPLATRRRTCLGRCLRNLRRRRRKREDTRRLFRLLSGKSTLTRTRLSRGCLRTTTRVTIRVGYRRVFVTSLVRRTGVDLLVTLKRRRPRRGSRG